MLDLLYLLWTFFKIGLFTFGGGYAMIPLITEEVVKNNWMQTEQLIDFIAIAESTPGPFAINIATFVGFSQEGILGSLFATLGVVLPSFIIIVIIAKLFHKFATNKYVVGFLKGVKPVVVGVIFSVAIAFILKNVFNFTIAKFEGFIFKWETLLIFAVVFSLTQIKKKMHPAYIVLISGILGLIIYGLII